MDSGIKDEEMANKLYKEGGFLVLLGVPKGTVVGLDLKYWQVSDSFMGFKMVPEGTHFLYYSYVSKESSVGHRTGMFLDIIRGKVIVKKWDSLNEDFADEDQDVAERYVQATLNYDFDAQLAPYPFQLLMDWASLSDKIYLCFRRLEPVTKRISPLMEVDDQEKTSKLASFTREEIEREPAKNKNKIFWSEIPLKIVPPNCDPQLLTRLSLDRSHVLEYILQKVGGEENLLGEFQFAFVILLCAYSYEGFTQWKQIFCLMCSCFDSMHERPLFFRSFFNVFRVQMSRLEDDFFMEEISSSEFLQKSLSPIVAESEEEGVDAKLRKELLELKSFLEKKFSLSITEEEDEEDKPVVVSLD